MDVRERNRHCPNGRNGCARKRSSEPFDPPGAEGRIQSPADTTTPRPAYTPPAGDEYFAPPSNIVAVAANAMMDALEEGLGYIEDNRLTWPQAIASAAIDGIHWQIINSARIALNAVRTASFRQKFCEESASWPTGVNGERP